MLLGRRVHQPVQVLVLHSVKGLVKTNFSKQNKIAALLCCTSPVRASFVLHCAPHETISTVSPCVLALVRHIMR